MSNNDTITTLCLVGIPIFYGILSYVCTSGVFLKCITYLLCLIMALVVILIASIQILYEKKMFVDIK